jgi:hypothetical protein
LTGLLGDLTTRSNAGVVSGFLLAQSNSGRGSDWFEFLLNFSQRVENISFMLTNNPQHF